jgi:hypothetical protein
VPAIKLASATNRDDDHVDFRQPGACGAGTDRRTAHLDAADAGVVPAIYAIFDDMEDSLGD